jgi:hypothetical protein
MELATTTMLIKRYLESLEGARTRCRPGDPDEEILEVLSGVSWVREALAQATPGLAHSDQREVLFGLKSVAA